MTGLTQFQQGLAGQALRAAGQCNTSCVGNGLFTGFAKKKRVKRECRFCRKPSSEGLVYALLHQVIS
ncbi:hypothetical protein AO069_24515 [Pseudomonas syringae pv. syringae PD2774]|nr:hypothetical protein AO069_24515 [Pseudomonas syringae pv. syringae PD2774]